MMYWMIAYFQMARGGHCGLGDPGGGDSRTASREYWGLLNFCGVSGSKPARKGRPASALAVDSTQRYTYRLPRYALLTAWTPSQSGNWAWLGTVLWSGDDSA